MQKAAIFTAAALLAVGCGPRQAEAPPGEASAGGQTPLISVEAPEPLPVPERVTPKSETDWPARVVNKEAELIETINIINPVAVYLTEGFKKYGNKLSPELLDEWRDTQEQLKSALEAYDAAKERKKAGKMDKETYLVLEGSWQLLVKTGVAGLRTKTMLDEELRKMGPM